MLSTCSLPVANELELYAADTSLYEKLNPFIKKSRGILPERNIYAADNGCLTINQKNRKYDKYCKIMHKGRVNSVCALLDNPSMITIAKALKRTQSFCRVKSLCIFLHKPTKMTGLLMTQLISNLHKTINMITLGEFRLPETHTLKMLDSVNQALVLKFYDCRFDEVTSQFNFQKEYNLRVIKFARCRDAKGDVWTYSSPASVSILNLISQSSVSKYLDQIDLEEMVFSLKQVSIIQKKTGLRNISLGLGTSVIYRSQGY
ncbi:unnamed protein product [Moneuplotes crassus]|uniref:Uncharacterized protein n=1 Tax=Euplotes crassus TaxID=5936 RepID=A0AAD1XQS2_EUPCR|nr:unnamed protein product [Moneuplotes crassus]